MSSKQVRWLHLALQDLSGIAKYLSQHGDNAANDVAEHIWQAGLSLADMPSRGRAGRVPATRELVLTKYPYVLVYRVEDGKVQILRIIHTSRQYAN